MNFKQDRSKGIHQQVITEEIAGWKKREKKNVYVENSKFPFSYYIIFLSATIKTRRHSNIFHML